MDMHWKSLLRETSIMLFECGTAEEFKNSNIGLDGKKSTSYNGLAIRNIYRNKCIFAG